MKPIDTDQLLARMANGRQIWLVHASERASFRSVHLPGALTFADADQAAAFLRPDDTVVVYGLGPACRASRELATDLARRRFVDVWLYAEGLESWIAAGGHVEGTRGPGHT